MAVAATPAVDTVLLRRRLRVRGAVQGVGFRPFCAQLATQTGVTGWVRNDGDGAALEVQGSAAALDTFVAALWRKPPPLARVRAIEPAPCAPQPDEQAFVIAPSAASSHSTTLVPADAATCDACLAELFDATNRRYRYPFINCTHCGPRWTITRGLPYDRPATSMAGFALCAACAREYGSPADRRFHAQPNACATCGPALRWWGADGAPAPVDDVIATACAALCAGHVVAIKGLGGFHLVCDARRADTLARLRAAKTRATKPFAVMCLNVRSAAKWASIEDAAAALLASSARPIVLLDKRPAAEAVLAGVAPGVAEFGLMLPSAPLHWLLFHELLGRPAGTDWLQADCDIVLVMTSANPGGEPLVIDNDEALQRLRGLADGYVVHDRPIVARCDDSVVRAGRAAAPNGFQFVRRARGYVPVPIPLPGVAADAPPVLACGAWLKNTVCVTRGNEAFLSPHIGDLASPASCAALGEAVTRLTTFLDVRPQRVLHDLHPDFYSTRFAASYAREAGVEATGVQHHHAHIAAVCAESGATQPVLGIALDGFGLGTDGAAWGGELLRVEGAAMQRLGHLAPLRLPGGDAAAREPWRVAASVLCDLGRGGEIVSRFGHQPGAALVAQMLSRNLHCVPTTSAGRVFDAAAALLGIAELNRHESEAAMALEAAAAPGRSDPWEGAWLLERGTLDLRPLLERLAASCGAPGASVAQDAARFHATFAAAVVDWADRGARAHGLMTVVLAGGCWLNRRLRHDVVTALATRGYTVLEAHAAPPNDGGVSLGQAWLGLQLASKGT